MVANPEGLTIASHQQPQQPWLLWPLCDQTHRGTWPPPDPEGLTTTSHQHPQQLIGRGRLDNCRCDAAAEVWALGPRPPQSWLERWHGHGGLAGMAAIGRCCPEHHRPYDSVAATAPAAAVVGAGVAAPSPKVWPAPLPGSVRHHCHHQYCGGDRHQPHSRGRHSASAAGCSQPGRLRPVVVAVPLPRPSIAVRRLPVIVAAATLRT